LADRINFEPPGENAAWAARYLPAVRIAWVLLQKSDAELANFIRDPEMAVHLTETMGMWEGSAGVFLDYVQAMSTMHERCTALLGEAAAERC